MKIVFSVPTGYHIRELILPLRELLISDSDIEQVIIFSPASPHRAQIFPDFPAKFTFEHTPDLASALAALTAHQPDLVITDTTGLDEYDTPILKAADQLHVTSATFIASWDNIWKIKRHQGEQFFARNFIVWNQMMADHLLKTIPDPDHANIAVIGAPRFDFFTHTANIPSRKTLFQHLGLKDLHQPLIHFATTELYPLDYVLKAIYQASQKNIISPPPHLFASIHPGGDLNNHQSSLAPYHPTIAYSFGRQKSSPHPNFLYRPSISDIYLHIALFKYADLLINHSSTVALESFAADTPVINVNYAKPWHQLSWLRSIPRQDFSEHYADLLADHPSQVVTSKSQLIAATNAYLANPALDHPARKSTLSKMTTITDGTASISMLNHLKHLASHAS